MVQAGDETLEPWAKLSQIWDSTTQHIEQKVVLLHRRDRKQLLNDVITYVE